MIKITDLRASHVNCGFVRGHAFYSRGHDTLNSLLSVKPRFYCFPGISFFPVFDLRPYDA